MAEVGKRGYFYAKCAETRPKDLLLSWGPEKWTAKSRKCSSQTEKNKISRKIEKKRNGKIASSQMCPKDNAIEKSTGSE